VIAPRPVRLAARAGLGLYAAVVCSAVVDPLRSGHSRRDAALVPVVLVVMHAAFGAGMLAGMARFGVPSAALRSMSGAPPAQPAEPEPVFAPSLR
jgi:hypothetical protein